ncbi:MAG: ZIP family metal transporter [Candidatus Hodarchaeales archaeon]
MDSEIIIIGIVASLLAGISTGIGAIPIFFKKDISKQYMDILLGFAAGVMLAASAFSLLVPALEMENVFIVAFSFGFGGLFIHLIDRWAPHQHFIKGKEGLPMDRLSALWLFIIAITIHNFPEGLAVGVAFGSEEISTGIIIAIAIALQNIPEGSAVAFPMVREGYTKRKAFGIATVTGLVEPIGGAIGVIAVTLATGLLGFGMAFAAGAMVFVVSDEIIPESHRLGHERGATMGLLLGFIIMMVLDNLIVID